MIRGTRELSLDDPTLQGHETNNNGTSQSPHTRCKGDTIDSQGQCAYSLFFIFRRIPQRKKEGSLPPFSHRDF